MFGVYPISPLKYLLNKAWLSLAIEKSSRLQRKPYGDLIFYTNLKKKYTLELFKVFLLNGVGFLLLLHNWFFMECRGWSGVNGKWFYLI